MIVYLARDIAPFVMYCVNGKPCSSLLTESTDSMIMHGKLVLSPESLNEVSSHSVVQIFFKSNK